MGKDTVTDARKTPPHSDGERHVTKGQQCRRLRVEILGLAECVPEQWKRDQQVPLRLAARILLTDPPPEIPPEVHRVRRSRLTRPPATKDAGRSA